MAGLLATCLAIVRYKTSTEQCHFKQNQNNGCLQATNRPSGISQHACSHCASLNDKPGQEAITRHHDLLVFTNGASFQVPASAKVMPTMAEKINLVLVTSSITTIQTCFPVCLSSSNPPWHHHQEPQLQGRIPVQASALANVR